MAKMNVNNIYFSYLIIFLCLFSYSIKAQTTNSKIQIDTVKISTVTNPLTYIFKIDTTEYNSDYYTKNLITRIKVFNLSDDRLIQTFSDTSELNFSADGVQYVDINMDGYIDIDINLGFINMIPQHSFWLFNKSLGKYYHSSDYSELNDYGIDSAKKQISSSQLFLGGKGGNTDTYDVKNGELTLIKAEYSYKYDYEKKELVNGKLITVSKVQSNEGIDKQGKMEINLITYNYVMDSLMVTEKSWLTSVQKENNKMWDSDIYDCEPWGDCMKYVRKEEYSYHNRNNKIIRGVKKYQVVDDKWELVKEFTK